MANLVKTGLEGFLDGYKAKNLAANKLTFDFHIEEMARLVDKLIVELNLPQNDNAIQTLNKGKSYLMQNIETSDPTLYYTNSLSFGESLKTFLDLNTNLEPGVMDILQKSVYHYLNLAKKLEDDERITNLARAIANKFQSLK